MFESRDHLPSRSPWPDRLKIAITIALARSPSSQGSDFCHSVSARVRGLERQQSRPRPRPRSAPTRLPRRGGLTTRRLRLVPSRRLTWASLVSDVCAKCLRQRHDSARASRYAHKFSRSHSLHVILQACAGAGTSSSVLILFKSASPVPSVPASFVASAALSARICIIGRGGIGKGTMLRHREDRVGDVSTLLHLAA